MPNFSKQVIEKVQVILNTIVGERNHFDDASEFKTHVNNMLDKIKNCDISNLKSTQDIFFEIGKCPVEWGDIIQYRKNRHAICFTLISGLLAQELKKENNDIYTKITNNRRLEKCQSIADRSITGKVLFHTLQTIGDDFLNLDLHVNILEKEPSCIKLLNEFKFPQAESKSLLNIFNIIN